MASITEIANLALRFIGASRITALNDNSKNANILSDLWDETLDQMLRAHNWNFATKRAELARSEEVPEFEFQYFYTLPADWVRTVTAHDNDAGDSTLYFREEAGKVAASVENVWLRYVYRCEDPNLMTPAFRRAFASALARDAAIAITNSGTLFDRMEKQALSDLMKAKSADAISGGIPEMRPAGSWVTARWGMMRGWTRNWR